ncbi:MAG: hypothetical protein AVDCRST_MAG10-616, partial [uncultured Acidimicrobiales bacterium]
CGHGPFSRSLVRPALRSPRPRRGFRPTTATSRSFGRSWAGPRPRSTPQRGPFTTQFSSFGVD